MVDFTKNGKCQGCGSCCSMDLPLTEKEVEKLKIKIKPILPKIKKNFESNKIDMRCPFLMSNKKCKIYLERPSICRVFSCNIEKFRKTSLEYQYRLHEKTTKSFVDVLPKELQNLLIQCINQGRIKDGLPLIGEDE